MADAGGLKLPDFGREGSSPSPGTNYSKRLDKK